MTFLRIAHRGGAALNPENTLSAFADAIARGADGAELDVQLTRDEHVVVFHDFCLTPDICRGGNGHWLTPPAPKVVQVSLSDLGCIDVGRARPDSEYASRHPLLQGTDDERIPLLGKVAELARHAQKPFFLFVELKSSIVDPALSAPAQLLAEKALSVLVSADYLHRTVFVGFDWRGLLHIKALEPSARCWFTTFAQSWFGEGEPPAEDAPPPAPALQMLRRWAETGSSPWAAGFDAVNFDGSILEAIKAAGGDGWFVYSRDATKESLAAAHRLGLKAGAWTVDNPDEMRMLASYGIDAICTDRTDLITSL